MSALKLDDPPEPEICNTPDCVVAAHSLIQNMDLTADPCEDFYQYACGNFEKRVSLPTFCLQNLRNFSLWKRWIVDHVEQ